MASYSIAFTCEVRNTWTDLLVKASQNGSTLHDKSLLVQLDTPLGVSLLDGHPGKSSRGNWSGGREEY